MAVILLEIIHIGIGRALIKKVCKRFVSVSMVCWCSCKKSRSLSWRFSAKIAFLHSVAGSDFIGLTIYLVLYFPKAFPNALDKKI